MLTPNNICSDSNIICNSDYGVSIGRGSFGFATGQCVFLQVVSSHSLKTRPQVVPRHSSRAAKQPLYGKRQRRFVVSSIICVVYRILESISVALTTYKRYHNKTCTSGQRTM